MKHQSFAKRRLSINFRNRLRLLGLTIVLLLRFGSQGMSQENDGASLPNLVIIMVDDMGYGDPKCFNPDSLIETPHIDQLAASGMRFVDAHAPGPLCHMSRYGLLTGQYPFRINVGVWARQPLIREGQTTIASLARSQGYRTAMVGKWHLGFEADKDFSGEIAGGPVDRGFDSFFGFRASTDIPPYFYIRDRKATQPPTDNIDANRANRSAGWSPIQGKFWRAGKIGPDVKLEEVTPRFTEEAIQVIREHAAEDSQNPLMLYLAYPAPHTPWLPSEDFESQSQVGLYGDFATMVDAEIGKVLAALAAAEMDRNTMVIFTSDNGPVWYDDDVEKYQHDSAGTLRGMKADAWEAGHRMPFIVRWPQVIAPGTTSKQTICFTDILATMAELFQVELGPEEGPDSFSFLPVLIGEQPESEAVRGPIVMSPGAGQKMMMVRSGEWKLIRGMGSGGFSKPNYVKSKGEPLGQLYNLNEDLGETENLYQSRKDVVDRLLAEMQEVVESRCSRLLEF